MRIKGTLLLAEGINGTIAGHREGIDRVLSWLRSDPRLGGFNGRSLPCERTVSSDEGQAEKEIVTMGVDDIDPLCVVGMQRQSSGTPLSTIRIVPH